MYGGDELGLLFPDSVLVLAKNLVTLQKFHELPTCSMIWQQQDIISSLAIVPFLERKCHKRLFSRHQESSLVHWKLDI